MTARLLAANRRFRRGGHLSICINTTPSSNKLGWKIWSGGSLHRSGSRENRERPVGADSCSAHSANSTVKSSRPQRTLRKAVENAEKRADVLRSEKNGRGWFSAPIFIQEEKGLATGLDRTCARQINVNFRNGRHFTHRQFRNVHAYARTNHGSDDRPGSDWSKSCRCDAKTSGMGGDLSFHPGPIRLKTRELSLLARRHRPQTCQIAIGSGRSGSGPALRPRPMGKTLTRCALVIMRASARNRLARPEAMASAVAD